METVTSADGTTIAFDRIGSGPPLILLPGATCTRGVSRLLAEALSEHMTVLNVDRRGRGDSDDLAAPPPYLAERETEDVAALIDAAGGHAALYGHSSGAGVALRAAASDLAVDRLVMHDAPYNLPGSEQHGREWDARLHEILADGRPGDAVAAFMRMVGMPEPMVEGMRRSPSWPAMEAVGPTLAYDSAAMGDRTGGTIPLEALGRVSVPTLVLVGGADHGFMVDVAHRLADGLPDAHFEQMEGAGHDVGPEVVVPRLVPFLLA